MLTSLAQLALEGCNLEGVMSSDVLYEHVGRNNNT